METEVKKSALTAAERQAKRREKAAEQGLKSVSVGLIRIEHEQAFKDAAKASRNGLLEMTDAGELVRPVDRVVEKEVVKVKTQLKEVPQVVEKTKLVRVIDVEQSGWWLIPTAGAIGMTVGFVLGWLI